MKEGEAVKYNKPLVTDKRKQTQIKLDILWEGKKPEEMRQSLRF